MFGKQKRLPKIQATENFLEAVQQAQEVSDPDVLEALADILERLDSALKPLYESGEYNEDWIEERKEEVGFLNGYTLKAAQTCATLRKYWLEVQDDF